MKRTVVLLFILLSFFSSCKNELDVLADYKQQFVIYGILNPKESVHYIRVSKLFVGEGNALVMAQNRDSIAIRPEFLHAEITRILNGVEMSTYILQPDSVIPRDSGIFLYPHQILYKGEFPVYPDGSIYRIKVTDIRSGYTATADTKIVADVIQTQPSSIWQPLNFEDTTVASFQFLSPYYGKKYMLALRFHYSEQFIVDTTQTSEHYVDWFIGEAQSSSNSGGENLRVNVRRDNFMRMLNNNIAYNATVRRIAGGVQFIYTSVSEDYVTYKNVQDANNNTSAEVPPFTNVNDGLGLFTSRNNTTIGTYYLDADTRYALVTSSLVQDLNFVR
ncbi:MAG: hypothetical protein RL007_2020 [Bacteroidota bacterium]|jgi:hypothetical protein